MLNLYAINLHLQEHLEREWRDEVRAVEAAGWLDEVGLLHDRKGGLPLRNLLRAGRIAGQEQRPNKKNGSWFINRLAKSRDPQGIRRARERLRRYLPINRNNFSIDWPVDQGPSSFWQELGKTVAAFGYLEYILASTCYALLATGERAKALLDAGDDHALSEWFKRVARTHVDSLHSLTREFDWVMHESSRIPHNVRENIVERLKELKPFRNALCHGAWLSIDDNGLAHLHHVYPYEGIWAGFEPEFTIKDLSDIRGRTVDTIFQIAEVASIAGPDNTYAAGPGFALVTDMPRHCEPGNPSAERE